MNEPRQLDSYTAPKEVLEELLRLTVETEKAQISPRQSDYRSRMLDIDRSGVSKDPFDAGHEDGVGSAGYREAMRPIHLEQEEQRVKRIIEAGKDEAKAAKNERETDIDRTPPRVQLERAARRKRRWDVVSSSVGVGDQVVVEMPKRSKWDQTPSIDRSLDIISIPVGVSGGNQIPTLRRNATIADDDSYHRYFTNEEPDVILPSSGYIICNPPEGYVSMPGTVQKLSAPRASQPEGFYIQDNSTATSNLVPELPTDIPGIGNLAFFKESDSQYFADVLKGEEETALSIREMKVRKVMRLLLKVKNGTPQVRKTALRQITERAREFGPGPLFDSILPLLMERTLEDQERHMLVKVIDRVLFKLDDLVRPYVHKILVVIEPLLIDADYYTHAEGREIISNLSKAAGLAHMISTMRPDIDHTEDAVRNATARAFSVVASALGIPSLLPFLKAVCHSRKSWQARHTGIRTVQQIAILMGNAVLPYLRNLVDAIAHGLTDDQQKVRTMTALAISALAEAAAPYGIESFDAVLKPLWFGIRQHRGKGLAAFLKAIGFIFPLMDPDHVGYYTKEVMIILLREFHSADEEMKEIVLNVTKQCAGTEGVTPAFIKQDILPEFFKAFWVRPFLFFNSRFISSGGVRSFFSGSSYGPGKEKLQASRRYHRRAFSKGRRGRNSWANCEQPEGESSHLFSVKPLNIRRC